MEEKGVLAEKELQIQSHVDSINEAIDVMLELVPGEETANDSRILRAICSLQAVKRFLEGL